MSEQEYRMRCLQLAAEKMNTPWLFTDVVWVADMLSTFVLVGTAPQVNLREDKSDRERACSFCGKGSKEVVALIAGPSQFICNECVSVCSEIVEKKAP